MKEDLLQAAWLYRWYRIEDIRTRFGRSFEVLSPGLWNRDAGPDFLDARILMDDTTWAGPVEIHIRSSDWNRHGHQRDPQYENVILHVVLEMDSDVFTVSGRKIETVPIRPMQNVMESYRKLMHNAMWVPCADRFPVENQILLFHLYDRLMVERLEKRHEMIIRNLDQSGNNWDFVFRVMLARSLGGHLNGLPMELLIKSLTSKNILHYAAADRFVLAAVLFGLSALDKPGHFSREYWEKLLKEYRHLKNKYELQTLDPGLWRFARVRPNSFPPVLIQRMVDLLHSGRLSLPAVLSATDLSEVRNMIGETGSVSDRIIINALVPVLFSYGKIRNKEMLQERALQFLEQIKPEDNRIIRGWRAMGLIPENALNTQSLIHLKNKYCNFKQCLRCPVGIHYLAEQG